MPKYATSSAVLLRALSGRRFVLQSRHGTQARPRPAAAAGGPAGGGPVPVVTAQAVRRRCPSRCPPSGTTEAISSVDIRSQITGQLTAIHFTEGQDVQQGEPLFTLDSRQYKTAMLQAQAALARDTATLKNLESQQARNETLFQRGLISKDQFESLRASVAALNATVEADKAAIETARVNLALRGDCRADQRPHRLARRARRRPHPRQRHDAARGDQPDRADLRHLLGAGPVPERHPALSGASGRSRSSRRCPTRPSPTFRRRSRRRAR